MRALVTGGLGFLGSHLVDDLLAKGYQVTIVDSLLSNVMKPADYPSCTIIEAPIEDCFRQLMPANGASFSEIYHLASVVGPAGVLKHSGTIARQVINSAEAVTELALAHKAKLLITSTSEVYGKSRTFHENDDCIITSKVTVRLEYAVAKLTSEVAAINRAKVTDLDVNVVRPFNIAGPRQLPGGGFVLPRFVISAMCGRSLTVFGDGKQVRAFTDVRDMVAGIRAIVSSPYRARVFNLGNPANEVSIGELAQRVVNVVGPAPIDLVDPKVLFGPLYEEGFEKVPVATTATEQLNWHPLYSLEDTIRSTWEWYKKRPDLCVVDDKPLSVARS